MLFRYMALFEGGEYMSLDLEESRKIELIEALSKDLVVLRAKSGVSQEELSKSIGISRQTYQAIETGKRKMTWRTYLALLLYFDYNPMTHDMLRSLKVFPEELRDAGRPHSESLCATSERCE